MALITFTHTYAPRIVIGSTNFSLPQPLVTTNEKFTNRFKSVAVPLKDGVIVSGVARGALTVSFAGQISKNTLPGVLHFKQRLTDLLMNSGGQTFTLYRYFDSKKNNFRFYEDCIASDLSFAFTSRQTVVLDYSFNIVVPSGVERELITTVGDAAGGDIISKTIRNGAFVGDDDSDIATIGDATLPANRLLIHGPVLIKLLDSAGASSVLIRNSLGQFIFRIDSDGAVQVTQPIQLVETISAPTT